MKGKITRLTLGSKKFFRKSHKSFNNNSSRNPIRNYFFEMMNSILKYDGSSEQIPSQFLHDNVHKYSSGNISKKDNGLYVGEYCSKGLIIRRGNGPIVFTDLCNCSPLISLIRGNEDYISFLHTWAIEGDSAIVDKQVKHWMGLVSGFGDILETVFAPRKNSRSCDTNYDKTPDYLQEFSNHTIMLNRNIVRLKGITDTKGVYFDGCGYHLWEN